jgi:hypothetical protein
LAAIESKTKDWSKRFTGYFKQKFTSKSKEGVQALTGEEKKEEEAKPEGAPGDEQTEPTAAVKTEET